MNDRFKSLLETTEYVISQQIIWFRKGKCTLEWNMWWSLKSIRST